MKTNLSILIFFLALLHAQAQHSLSGLVRDGASRNPVAFATVALMERDSSIVTGVTTDDAGRFLFQNIKPGSYLTQVSFIGYEKVYNRTDVPAQSDLGEILLKESANKLNEIVVTGNRPFVEQRVDRYVVNVGSHVMTAGHSVLDVLGKTPGILVSPDGDISVVGNSGNIYIDGRPTNLTGAPLKAMLSTMQGETVDRIEVITNPSSRYDASGGSVVNIRTKKGLQYGLNGTVNAGYRQNRTDRENTGLSLNFRGNKLNVFGDYNIERSRGWVQLLQVNELDRNGARYHFEQHAKRESVEANFGQQYKLGADLFINDKHTLGALFSGYHTGDAETRIRSNTSITPSLEGVYSTASDSRTSNGNDGKQWNLNYQGLFASGRQLNVDVDYGRFESVEFQRSLNEYFDAANERTGEEQLRHTVPPAIELRSIKADYVQPLGENTRMEFGGKSSRSRTDNNLLYETYNDDWITDTDRSNHFIYTEQIDAAYVSLSKQFGRISLQAGLRGEYTHSTGEQKTTGETNDSTYLNLFPTLNIGYSHPKAGQFSFSYGRRIMRPSYTQLNPFEVALDAYSFTSGNPYLKPLIMNNFSLSHISASGLMIRLSYNIYNNLIETLPVQENNRYGTRLENFEQKTSIGMMVNYRKRLAQWWTFNVMAQGDYARNSSKESYGTYENKGIVVAAVMQNSFTIQPAWTAELNVMYASPQRLAYLYSKPMTNVSIGISKSLLKNKLAVSLSVNDLFSTYVIDMSTKNTDTDYRMKIDRDLRWVNLGIRYMFGSDKVKASRRRSVGIEEETGRVK